MYMTLFAGSPCAKTVSFPLNLVSFLPRPVESRNCCTSKAGLLKFSLGAGRRTAAGIRRVGEGLIELNFDSGGGGKHLISFSSLCSSFAVDRTGSGSNGKLHLNGSMLGMV